MCGIFGYIGPRVDAPELVMEGLKLLEYRGYDSWGIAAKIGNVIQVDKHIGKIGNANVDLPPSSLSIGHTRWATHGGVTDLNAHPHLDCTQHIAVIHNGIIENYLEIKEELLNKGHTFKSETDTEVIPHLIEEYLKQDIGFAHAFRRAFKRLHGLNAIVSAYSTSKEILAAKTGSPLIVGVGESELFLASDASAIIPHTRKLVFIKDGEMVILGEEMQLITIGSGDQIEPKIEEVDWKIESADMGNYPHFMIKEMHDQANIIRNIASTYEDQIVDMSSLIKEAFGTYFIGSGTAFNATLAGTYMFSKIAKKHVNTAQASEFNYLEDFLTDRSLIIALSQSGETIDVIEPLNRAKQKGSKIATLVNTLGSTIYRMADKKILLGAGPEKAVASTKAYVAKLSILLMLANALVDNLEVAKKELTAAATEVDRLLESKSISQLDTVADQLMDVAHIYTVGRGISFATALESALKIKEITYIHAEGLAGGELKHGPIALITKGTSCIVFAPSDETYSAMISNAMEIKARGGVIIGVSSKYEAVFDHWIEVKDCGNATLIPQVVPMQYLAYSLAVRKNLDPDKPRNLAKSVTVK